MVISLFDTGEDRMDLITKEAVEAARDKQPKRICFSTTHTKSLNHYSYGDFVGAFNVPFGEGFSRVFPYDLFPDRREGKSHEDAVWRGIKTEEEFEEIEAWLKQQKDHVFLRDCLYTSIALSHNFSSDDESKRTGIGELEYQAKWKQDAAAIRSLAGHCVDTIQDIPLYKNSDFICAVPPKPGKDFDLPSLVARNVSEALNKENITCHFKFSEAQNIPLKSISLSEKWSAWESAGLSFEGIDITDKNIALIDDTYQSGTTIQYVAMKLQAAGARQVYGLSMVKTMKDTDNQ